MDLQVKSNFLQKKKQQKKNKQDQAQKNKAHGVLTKNIKSFIARTQMVNTDIKNTKMLIFMKQTHLSDYPQQIIKHMHYILSNIQNQQTQWVYFCKFVYCSFKDHRLMHAVPAILQMKPNFQRRIANQPQFLKELNCALRNGLATAIFSQILESLEQSSIKGIENSYIWDIIMKQSNLLHLQIQSSSQGDQDLNALKLIFLLNHLSQENYYMKKQQNLQTLLNLTKKILSAINPHKVSYRQQKALIYCLRIFIDQIITQNKKWVNQLAYENKHLINLISDQQEIQYIENKIRSDPRFQQFSNICTDLLEKLFKQKILIQLFKSESAHDTRKTIVEIIKSINQIFDGRKLFFVKEILSSDQTLQTLVRASPKQPLFYESLKMKIISMDDQQFRGSNLFSGKQWESIIKDGISASFSAIKKNILSKETQKKNLELFAVKDQNDIFIKTMADLFGNIHKKALRTKKIHQGIFINEQLNNMFYTFTFGTGARALETMLKNFPYVFTFEARLQKLNKFIKEDKKNHDRTLFVQDQIDEDLIIEVRRGYQFMDAFQACMARDLRKKYKIVFFNQQGLQQQGIDGGGIIKQFINRVLKSGFSQTYQLFYDTPRNQLLPNPQSLKNSEYQFLGKIVGKAVYEGIIIEPKFAQPFLNLLIGRQNSFEDLQFFDQKIYKSLVEIKHMGPQINQLFQTFTIMDFQPNGKYNYVNLLNPGKPALKEIYVTEQNKLNFIMAYADYKCNRQLRQKTRLFRKGFLKVMKSQWLTMFSNQQLNLIISGGKIDFPIKDLKKYTVYNDYHEKHPTIVMFWEVLDELNVQEKSLFLHYVTSCSRPPTLGFNKLKPHFCIANGGADINKLPTANTCMNVLRLPNYKTKEQLRQKLKYAISAKAGFQFA